MYTGIFLFKHIWCPRIRSHHYGSAHVFISCFTPRCRFCVGVSVWHTIWVIVMSGIDHWANIIVLVIIVLICSYQTLENLWPISWWFSKFENITRFYKIVVQIWLIISCYFSGMCMLIYWRIQIGFHLMIHHTLFYSIVRNNRCSMLQMNTYNTASDWLWFNNWCITYGNGVYPW